MPEKHLTFRSSHSFFSSSSLQLSTPLLTCRTRDGGTQRTKWRCFAHTKDGGRKTCVTYSILWIEVVCIRCNRLNDERQKVSHAPSCVYNTTNVCNTALYVANSQVGHLLSMANRAENGGQA